MQHLPLQGLAPREEIIVARPGLSEHRNVRGSAPMIDGVRAARVALLFDRGSI
jgi:hypothetical protein